MIEKQGNMPSRPGVASGLQARHARTLARETHTNECPGTFAAPDALSGCSSASQGAKA